MVINTIVESAKHLNKSILKRQKYNLVNEIKNHYNVDDFFKMKLPNYKAQASLFTLLEVYNSENLSNPTQIIENKTTLLEYLTQSTIDKKEVKNSILEEFKNQCNINVTWAGELKLPLYTRYMVIGKNNESK